MYTNKQLLNSRTDSLRQENEVLKLQVFALQQKKISNEKEISELRSEIQRLCSTSDSSFRQTRVQERRLRRVPYVDQVNGF